jgi:hypothetical protein
MSRALIFSTHFCGMKVAVRVWAWILNCAWKPGWSTYSTILCYRKKRYKNLRIHFIKRFPYGIHYLFDGNDIKVFGVFHTSRDPKNWSKRLKK